MPEPARDRNDAGPRRPRWDIDRGDHTNAWCHP